MGERECNQLAGVGGVGENLLVSGHRCVEAELPNRDTLGACALAPKYGSVGEYQNRGRAGRGGRACRRYRSGQTGLLLAIFDPSARRRERTPLVRVWLRSTSLPKPWVGATISNPASGVKVLASSNTLVISIV